MSFSRPMLITLTLVVGILLGVLGGELARLLIPAHVPTEADYKDFRQACAAWANERRSEIVLATWTGDVE